MATKAQTGVSSDLAAAEAALAKAETDAATAETTPAPAAPVLGHYDQNTGAFN